MKKFLYMDIVIILINLSLFLTNNLKYIDDLIYKNIYISDFLTPIFKIITKMSNTIPLSIIFILAMIILFIKGYKKESKILGIAFPLSAILMVTLKEIFKRPRPNVNRLISIDGFSYPSGHSLMSFLFYGYIIYLIIKNYKSKFKKTLISIICLLVVLIGYSRIYLGVHYFSDVIFGFSIAYIILYFVIVFTEKGKNK